MHTSTRCALALSVLALSGAARPVIAHAQPAWRAVELARIGGDDEGLASFNAIRDLQIGADGRIWVLDFQAQSLRLFGADGAPVKEVGRKGAGPGEIANSNGFRIGPDGKVVLRDHSNGRFSFYSPAGAFVGQHIQPSGGYGYRWDAAVDREGRLVELASIQRGQQRLRVIVRHSPDFATSDTAETPTTCSDLPPPSSGIRGRNGFAGLPFEPRIISVFAPDGATWCANTDEYRIRRFAFGAKAHDRELHATVPRIPIRDAERDSAIAGVEKFLERIGGAQDPFDKGKVRRDRGQLLWFEGDDQGRLWVMRETPAGQVELDIWDAAGRRIGMLAMGSRKGAFPLFQVRGDKLAIVKLDEDELPTIFVYRVGPNDR